MSFLNIENSEERDTMIEDYLALKERLKKRSMEERGQLMDRRRDLEENFEPVVASNEKMTKEIVDELTPITKELHQLNTRPKLAAMPIGVKRDIDSQPKSKQRLSSRHLGPYGEAFLANYLNPDTRNHQVDTTFGIRYENGSWMIGNKQIEIAGDDITIDGEGYEGTPGLWSLITDKTPTQYTEDDFQRYKELLYETSALHQHYDAGSHYPRASGGKKWTQILRPIWSEFQRTGIVESSEDDDSDNDSIMDTRVDRNSDDSDNDEFHESRDDLGASNLTDGNGVKMYLQKQGRCFGLQKCGNGVKLTPRPKLSGIRGNGLYLRAGSSIYDGHGLLLGSQSPFKHIPILGWLL